MAVQHVCDICRNPMTEWRNLLIGKVGSTPPATQLYRPEMGHFQGETEKEVCASCYATLDLWLRGVMLIPGQKFTPTEIKLTPNPITDAIGTGFTVRMNT